MGRPATNYLCEYKLDLAFEIQLARYRYLVIGLSWSLLSNLEDLAYLLVIMLS